MNRNSKCLIAALLFALCVAPLHADDEATPPGATLVRMEQSGPLELRGYGRVSAEGRLWNCTGGKLSLVRFHCQDAASAECLASKYRTDLLAYGAVKAVDTPQGLGGSALEVRHSGSWLLGVDGSDAVVASAPTWGAPLAAGKSLRADRWLPVKERAYPRYLDNFDNASLSIWWMPTTKSPEQLEWMRNHPAVANLHEQLLDMTPAPGVYDLSGSAHAITQFHQMGKPYRHMLWTGSGQHAWMNWNLLPGENIELLAKGFTGRRLFEAGGYNGVQVASPAVHAMLLDSMTQMMRRQGTDPDLLAWMEPHGEFHLSDPASFPPGYATRFPAYLQYVKNYSLETVSDVYTGDRKAYRSWSMVPYPDTAFFAGRRGAVIDLDDLPWKWKMGSLEDGDKDGWCKIDADDSSWTTDPRDSMRLLGECGKERVNPLWLRFSHEVPESFLKTAAGKKIYLHLMPYTEHEGRELTVWVNGTELGRKLFNPRDYINRHTQLDITTALKSGTNHFAIFSNGGRIAYRVFLSDTEGESFPFSDPRLNRRFLDWRDYVIWEKLQTLETYLRAMRSVDPVRPIKVMTPHLFQADAMLLFERYGAYPHLTGEGPGFYRPMHYKGYSSLRHLPGTSEPGGAHDGAEFAQGMFANIFWESQDCHDYVFDLTRELWSHKESLKWWTENKPLLRTLGKTDLAEPRLGVLRDVRQDQRFGNHQIWNWDLSRGPLPTLGLTPVLVDGAELERGVADRVPVIIDCASIIMEPAMVDAIERYVRQGGIFVAQHHTGQHTTERADSWPLATRFGLRVEPRLVNADNVHKWPVGKIRFTNEQTLFPSLRGKECEGSGVAIDWKNNEHTGAVAIEGGGPNTRPVALWQDGKMAVVELSVGKGKLIILGTPFFIRFKDENGRWFNQKELQGLIEEMLASLGVKRQTNAGDERIWFERRESKNGLYDVYFAAANGIRGKEWKTSERLEGELSLSRTATAPAVDATAEGAPDVPTTFANGQLSLGAQTFSPFQMRQFAIVRENVGLTGPLHWLEVQRRFWRALDPVPSSLADTIHADGVKSAAETREEGQDLNGEWKVRYDQSNQTDTTWTSSPPSGEGWVDGAMGSWLARGRPETTSAQYRRRVELPASWREGTSRILVGMSGYWQNGIRDTGSLWIDGALRLEKQKGHFLLDVTKEASDGVLDVALQVDGKGIGSGPVGTFFLRRVPAPTQTIELSGEWTKLESWAKDGGVVSVPLDGKSNVFGIKKIVKIPKEWENRPVRLAITQTASSRHGIVGGVIINKTGYFRSEQWEPVGSRLDRWLKPGEDNEIILLGAMHLDQKYNGFPARISSLRLEAY